MRHEGVGGLDGYETLAKHLKRFFIKDPSKEALFNELVKDEHSKAHIFQTIARNTAPNTLYSGKPEGKLKNT